MTIELSTTFVLENYSQLFLKGITKLVIFNLFLYQITLAPISLPFSSVKTKKCSGFGVACRCDFE